MPERPRSRSRLRLARAAVGVAVLLGTLGASVAGSAACAFVVAQIPDTGDCLPPAPGANAPVPDDQPPNSRFHHPKHGEAYPREDYRIRELHIYAGDNHGGQGVRSVEVALRRTSRKGACAWWDGQRFVAGACDTPLWHQTPAYDEGYFHYYRIPALRPSTGTGKVRDYAAIARATDAAGNVETSFEGRRNLNTFEISKR